MGEEAEREFDLATLLWEIIGFPLSWKKASAGHRAEWIGALLDTAAERFAVVVAIQDKKRVDLLAETRLLRSRPTASLKALRAFLGQVNFIAGLVVYVRAVLTWLCVALIGA